MSAHDVQKLLLNDFQVSGLDEQSVIGNGWSSYFPVLQVECMCGSVVLLFVVYKVYSGSQQFWKAKCSQKNSILKLVIAPSMCISCHFTMLAKYINCLVVKIQWNGVSLTWNKSVVLNKNKFPEEDAIHLLGVDLHIKDRTFEGESSKFLVGLYLA